MQVKLKLYQVLDLRIGKAVDLFEGFVLSDR